MTQPPWSLELYELQHRVWPRWSASEAGAAPAMDFLIRWLELAPGARILDLGCGVGRELVALAAKGMEVVGLDISAALVGRARDRIAAAALPGSAVAEVGDLLRPDTWPSEPPVFDLIMAWDSTLNIFSLDEAREIVRGWLPRLAPGAQLCVQQLHDRYWSKPRGPFVLEGEGVGPGRTVRRYRFEDGRLFDEVSYAAPGEPARELPRQELYLYPPARLEQVFAELGLSAIRSAGSTGHAWTEARAPDHESSMVITSARVS